MAQNTRSFQFFIFFNSPEYLLYINYILLKVVAALQMKSVILHAPATTSRLATPAAIKDGLLRVISIIYAIHHQTGNRSFVSQSGSPRGYIVCHQRCR